jgi:hypothetical protein
MGGTLKNKPLLKRDAPRVLLLRTCNADGTSYGGFKWPLTVGAEVTAPDWNSRAECGGGLHGLLWGEGDGSLLSWADDAAWLVVSSEAASVVNLNTKVKVPAARVEHVGTRESATAYLVEHGARGRAIVGLTATAGYDGTATAGHRGTATAGDHGTATAGDGGTATAGDGGTATAGHRGTATAGHRGTATAGDGGTATAGYDGTATAGDGGTATAGDGSTATAGYGGTATAGHLGTATAGDGGTATAGDHGTATAGHRGTATAGDFGTIVVRWYGGMRSRLSVAYVGENGIKANTPYRLNDAHEFVEVQ